MCYLDYTKCFDLLRPVAGKQLLDASGCCPRMSTLCTKMWSKHVRWPSWNGFLSSNPLDTKGLSIPQGDPLGQVTARSANQKGSLHEFVPPDRIVDDISFF